MSSDICFATAGELVSRMRTGDLSAVEVMEAHLAQIESINPQVNAIITLLPHDEIRAKARAADERRARNEDLGPLHGLPVAHKDLALTKGIRTSFGSLAFRDFIPEENSLIVERLQNAGAITIGKTNTPELGAGSQTYNEIFGETLNPYDLTKTCGGSSGGAAVSLACGMLPIADGSDMGGSLRNPASFCNVVGLRPSPGRVPTWPDLVGWFPLLVEGPMARTVEDVALMLSTIAGPDSRAPISIAEPGALFTRPLGRDFKDVRIAWSRTLGKLPVDPRVTTALDEKRYVFESLGCITDDVEPDFTDADDVFKVWRAWRMELGFAEFLEKYRTVFKDTVVWNIEEGMKLSGPQIGAAERKRTELYHRIRRLMETYDYLILPVSQVPPFDVKQRYVTRINDDAMETYIDWMKSCYYISVIGNPAISVPCGFTSDGLPVGIQIVGRHQNDFGVLQLAYAFEQATALWRHKPPIVQ